MSISVESWGFDHRNTSRGGRGGGGGVRATSIARGGGKRREGDGRGTFEELRMDKAQVTFAPMYLSVA